MHAQQKSDWLINKKSYVIMIECKVVRKIEKTQNKNKTKRNKKD